ncbi:hypothetical protein E1B28_003051 [Marasmius oreades]|uniref:Uncharacterized protein n=1 Tax=Marasmius oreades TaxID=181124 RepID=A0A9P7UK07_9AGAR|nr:uncharacterized protein E1B28_003051 [Marasmius oreades]KAG7085488.1 hypothetical protein E1B28_003051 [Marasmius oreades]
MNNLWSGGGGGQLGSVEIESEKGSSYPVPVTMDDSWRETGFSPSTFRHPFQVTAFPSSTPTTTPVRTQPPSTMDSSIPPQSQTITTSTSQSHQNQQHQHRHHQRRQSLSFFPPYPSRSLNPTPVSFSRREDGSSPLQIATALIPLLCFIPVPVLLSLLYLTLGHAVLSIHTVPVTTSLKSGVVGGAILALPLTIVFYLVYFPTTTLSSTSPPPEHPPSRLDFFDDDESRGGVNFNYIFGLCISSCCGGLISTNWRSLGQAVIVVFMGVVTGPLGVTVLSSADRPQEYLTAGQAARAGVVGGVILAPVIVGLSVVGVVFWRRGLRLGEEEAAA